MNFTVAIRTSKNQGLLAMVLRLHRASFLSAQMNLFISVSVFYMIIHKSQFEQNRNVVFVVTVVVVVVGVVVVVVVVVAVAGTMS